MRLVFLGLVFSLLILCGTVSAEGLLVSFSAETVHLQIGKSYLSRVYLKNPDSGPATMTATIGGDYPAGLAKFYEEPGASFTNGQRKVTFSLNPGEERAFTLEILSTAPKDAGYSITVDSDTTASFSTDSDRMTVSIDYAPSFPGMDLLSASLLVCISGALFYLYRIEKKR